MKVYMWKWLAFGNDSEDSTDRWSLGWAHASPCSQAELLALFCYTARSFLPTGSTVSLAWYPLLCVSIQLLGIWFPGITKNPTTLFWKVITPVQCLNITQGTFIYNLSSYPHNLIGDKIQATKCYMTSPEFNKYGPKLNSGLLTSDSFHTNKCQRSKSILCITKPQVFLRHFWKMFPFLWAYKSGSEKKFWMYSESSAAGPYKKGI